MSLIFEQASSEEFFNLLPADWHNSIVPFWKDYKLNSSIYTIHQNNQLIAGGIVFNTCSPDMLYNQIEANNWLEKGYLYIGFIWVKEEYRGQKIGSKWLHFLFNKYPNQKFWLTVEEENLIEFYTKNGFKLIKTLKNGSDDEWLLSYQPNI